VAKAFFSGIAEATGNEGLSDQFNDTIDEQEGIIGSYSIPEEQERVDRILREMPQNALDKLGRDVGKDLDGDGDKDVARVNYWNRAVIIIGNTDNLDKDGDGVDDVSISE